MFCSFVFHMWHFLDQGDKKDFFYTSSMEEIETEFVSLKSEKSEKESFSSLSHWAHKLKTSLTSYQ